MHTTVGNDEVSFPPNCRHTLLPVPDPRQISNQPSSKSLPVTVSKGHRCSPTLFHPKVTEAQVYTAASVTMTSNAYYVSPHDRRHLPGFVHPSRGFRMPIHHFMIDSMDDGLSPFSYFLLLLSVKTFATRIDGQQATARLAAKRPTSLISAFSTRVRFT